MERRGINQERLAKLSGLSSGHISEARRGLSAIGIDNLAKIADALQVLPMELLADDEETREEFFRRAMTAPTTGDSVGKVAVHSRRKKPAAGASH